VSLKQVRYIVKTVVSGVHRWSLHKHRKQNLTKNLTIDSLGGSLLLCYFGTSLLVENRTWPLLGGKDKYHVAVLRTPWEQESEHYGDFMLQIVKISFPLSFGSCFVFRFGLFENRTW